MPSSTVRWFRIAAIAEAVSWTGLLIGMVFKYLVVGNEIGVQIFGPVHGALFIAYVVLAVGVWRVRSWSSAVGVLAILAGIPPFGTVVFERWATRGGRLSSSRSAPPAARSAHAPR